MAHEVKPKLGIDLDGCVYSWSHSARTVLQLRGNDLPVRTCEDWDEIKASVSASEWKWCWNEGVREIFANMPAYPGAIKALRQLQEITQLVIITHRPLSVADLTLERLGRDRIRAYAVIHAHGEDKSTIMPDCIAYVEDKQTTVFELACTEVPVFMPRRPYNSLYHDPAQNDVVTINIRPYDDWQEVVTWVTQMVA